MPDQTLSSLAAAWNPPADDDATPTDLATAAPSTYALDDDGCPFDPETGEVLDVANFSTDELADALKAWNNVFEVTDRDSAEWALKRRAETEAEIAKLQLRLQAVTEGINAQIAVERRRLAWWDYRFEPGVIRVARTLLKKSKTALFDWGKVAFRDTRGTNTLIDMNAAVAWVRKYNPERVKVVESVTATDVLKTRDELAKETESDPEPLAFLVSSGPRESVSITTGIKNGVTRHGD